MSEPGKGPEGAAPPAAAPAPAPAPAPAAEAAPAPAPAPAEGAAPAAPVEGAAPPAEGAKPVEGAKPAEAPKPPEPEPSLLEQFDANGEKKPDGEKPKEGEKAAEGAKPPEAPPPYEFKPYQLPEGIKAEDPQIKQFNELLTKPDLDPQARGQELINLYAKNMQTYAEHLVAEQHRVFSETRKGWVNEIKSDPTIGGSGFNTTMMSVARMRDLFVPKEQMGAFNDFLKITGAGDHPAFIKLMANVAKRFDEPSPPPPSFKPPPDIGIKPGSRGRGSLYDHPNSVQRRGG